jgi:NTE family protein
MVRGLVMTGGGARGAYQAGVLKRIGEIRRVQGTGNPFPIIGIKKLARLSQLF